jgi:hypothetical protein
MIVVGRGFVGRSLHAAMEFPGQPISAEEAAVSPTIEYASLVVWASGTKAIGECESDPAMAACRNMRAAAKVARRADCSNVLKGIEDSLNGVAWIDDTQVGKVIVEKSFGTEGRTTIRIS